MQIAEPQYTFSALQDAKDMPGQASCASDINMMPHTYAAAVAQILR